MAIKATVYEKFVTLNTDDPTIIEQDELADSLNMIKRPDGLWENRKGIQAFGDAVGSGDPVHSLFFWKVSGGTRYFTVGSGTELYSYAEGSEYYNGVFTMRKNLTVNNQWEATVYRDTILIANGVLLQSSTDNITFTDRTGTDIAADASIVTTANDFVYYTDATSDRDKVFITALAPAQPWLYDPNNTLNLDIGNAEDITAAQALGRNMIITKSNQAYSVDLASLARENLDFRGGTESSRGLVQTQLNSILVAGRQGVFSLARTVLGNDNILSEPESNPIKKVYRTITDFTSIASAFWVVDNLVLFAADTSNGSLTFVRHLDAAQSWTYFRGVNATDFTTYQDADRNLHLLFGDKAVDRVWELFKGRNDNGAPIFSRLATKYDDFDNPAVLKTIHTVDFVGYISATGIWNIELYKDGQGSPFATAQITYDGQTISVINFIGPGSGGVGGAPFAESPLGGEVGEGDGDLEVLPFKARLPLLEDVQRLQVVLWNNQADVRVVIDQIIVYHEDRPYDFYENANIL